MKEIHATKMSIQNLPIVKPRPIMFQVLYCMMIALLSVAIFCNSVDASSHHINPISVGVRSFMTSKSNGSQFFHQISNRRRRRVVVDRGGEEEEILSSVLFAKSRNNGSDCKFGTCNFDEESELCGNRRGVILKDNSDLSLVVAASSTSSTDVKPKISASRAELVAGGATIRLSFWENMVCGAISRSVAQVATHPANTMKTLLQSNRNSGARMTIGQLAQPTNFKLLSRGAGAQFLLSVPHGAVNFAVLEFVRKQIFTAAMKSQYFSKRLESNGAVGPMMDFASSAVSTVCCSVISTPQMMVVDNIMAGTYSNLATAVAGLGREKGILGFYAGWWPGLAGKIPSYALTWTLFQQLKQAQLRIFDRPPKDIENSIMGCIASATSVCVMIPMDTIKTRLVTQMNYPDLVPYTGIRDAAVRIFREEGFGTFYRGLPPRLLSVVPMIGIQFGVYEFMKKVMVARRYESEQLNQMKIGLGDTRKLKEVMMEVAADDDQPFPAPLGIDYDNEEKPKKKRRAFANRK